MIRITFLFALLISFTQFAHADFNPATLTVETSKNKVEVKKEESREDMEWHEKLRSPQETMRTFMQAMDKVKAGNNGAFADAIRTLDLSGIDTQLRSVTGRITAERLINTLDRITHITYATIPSSENGPTWFLRKQAVTIGDDVHEVEIAIGKTSNGDWKFTPETVSSIENFYSSVSHLQVLHGNTEYSNWRIRFKSRMPMWTAEEFLMFKKGQWLGLICVFVVSLLAFTFVRFVITFYIRFKVKDRALDMADNEQFKSTLPFGYLAFALTWLIGVRPLEFDVDVLEIFIRASYILTAFFSVWAALTIVDYVSLHFEKKARGTANKFDDVLVPMVKKTCKVLVVTFGAILIAHSLTFDVASILAGLGIGGVAVALAAKDTISNLFGSVTVIIDRPFQIGDYIVLSKDLEGSVEEVGFRSTRLRTPVNSLVTLPNSVLANMAIDNYGMRRVRRYKTTLQLEYSTTREKLQEFCDRLRYQIQLNPMMLKDDNIVTIYELNTSSIDVLLTVYFVTGQQKVELAERHKFILEILKTAEELGVQFAYPTQTLHLEPATDKRDLPTAKS